MKLLSKLIIIISIIFLILSCHGYDNPYDKDGEDYQGWCLVKNTDPVTGEGDYEIRDIESVYNWHPLDWTNDTTPLFDWPDLKNAARYDFRWALSVNDLPSAAVHPVTESEYQFTTTLTAGNDVYWQLRIYDKYGNSSGWNYTGDEAPRYIHIY